MDTAPGRFSRSTGCGGKSSLPSNGRNLCCTSTGSQPGPSADREVGSTPTSSLPCCVTTSARTSWTLPPEDLLDAAYVPSLWAVQKTVLRVLLGIGIGPLSVASIAAPNPRVHRRLANAPRRRKPPPPYPVRDFFLRPWFSPPPPRACGREGFAKFANPHIAGS